MSLTEKQLELEQKKLEAQLQDLSVRQKEIEARQRELDLRQRELDIRIKDQNDTLRSFLKTFVTSPLLITITAAILTFWVDSCNRRADNHLAIEQQRRTMESNMVLKAFDGDNFDYIFLKLEAFDTLGYVKIDSNKLLQLKLDYYKHTVNQQPQLAKNDTAKQDQLFYTIIAGADTRQDEAQYEVKKARNKGMEDVRIVKDNNYLLTTVGNFSSEAEAQKMLGQVQQNVNQHAYIKQVKLDSIVKPR